MNKQTIKEIINFILVILFTYLYLIYIIPIIAIDTGGIFISTGIWTNIVGIWGNVVGFRVVKSFGVFNSNKKENYFLIVLGIILVVVGLFLKYLSRI
jgi:hypothetical protein